MRCKLLITSLCLSAILSALAGCRVTPEYRGMTIDPIEKELGYLTAENGHNITRTAEALGVERSHLHRKIKALALS